MTTRATAATLCAAILILLAPAAYAVDASVLPGGVDRQDEEADTDEGGGDAVDDEPAAPAPATKEDPELSIYRELKTVESQVDQLKEKVFRSKARLMLLEEKVIRGVVSGAKALVRHVNQLGAAFELQSITYYFDGNPIYQKTNVGTDGALAKTRKEQIFEANVPPGNHSLSVSGVIQGKGAGIFAYLADYTFQFSSSQSFVARDGKTTRIDSVLYRKGGALGDWAEAPNVEFRILSEQGTPEEEAGDGAAAEGSGS